jgi:hypothetical protein
VRLKVVIAMMMQIVGICNMAAHTITEPAAEGAVLGAAAEEA